MSRHFLCLLLLAALAATAQGQRDVPWQQLAEDLFTLGDDDADATRWEQSMELLGELAATPLDLNGATREELEQLPFLSAAQVADLLAYRRRYGPLRSMGELRMVRSLDYRQLALLPHFVTLGSHTDATLSPTPTELIPTPAGLSPTDTALSATPPPHYAPATPARHTLTATLRVPFYRRAGDRNGYLGAPLRHTLRYELRPDSRLRLGLVAAQDAGEPFGGRHNRQGYDFYSPYLQLRQRGCLENMVAGRYRLSTGMGLVMGQSFTLGKVASLQNMGRQMETLRPHSSRSEADYLQGVAATLRLSHALRLTAFASYRGADATLTADGGAQTLTFTGYHRTPREMERKHNTHAAVEGLRATLSLSPLRLGATVAATQLDRPLQPQRSTLFRRHYAHGSHFMNMSTTYGLTLSRLQLQGETAVDAHAHVATQNSLALRLTPRLDVLLVQRFYSFRYTSPWGHAFGEGGSVQNESGVYAGARWNPAAHVQVMAYADYARFPWARYQASLSSHACDLLLQGSYDDGHWTLTARHRSRLRQRDNEAKTALTALDTHRDRLTVGLRQGAWTLKSQADIAVERHQGTESGWMVSQQATLSSRHTRLALTAAYFHTTSYATRLYLSEPLPEHEYAFPSYYGKGLRLAAQARLDVGSHLRLSAHLGYTRQLDRATLGTALQQINHSHQTDLDVQLRVRF